MAILIFLAGLLMATFVVFAIISDPGTAALAKRSQAVLSYSTAAAAAAAARAGAGAGAGEDKEPLYGPGGLGNNRSSSSSSIAELQKQQKLQQEEEEEEEKGVDKWDHQDLETPLLGHRSAGGGGGDGDGNSLAGVGDGAGGGDEKPQTSPAGGVERPRQLSAGAASVHTVNLDNEEWHEGAERNHGHDNSYGHDHHRRRQAGVRQRPVVLRWSKLGYYVAGQGKGRGLEMAVLRGVSGFAGPVPSPQRSALPSARGCDDATATTATSSAATLSGDGGSYSSFCAVKGSTAAAAAAVASSTCAPSTMTGILGPSGAGKSSLLDLLAGRKRLGEGRATGSVSLDFGDSGGGDGGLRGPDAVRRVGGYVSQEDVLPGTLTCYEHLMFHARLRMPPGASFAERAERVLWVVEELGLSRVADSRIGDEMERGLSGGERRRLSIATALVARPALLFADEPTTGLGERARKGGGREYWTRRERGG